jgi:hypothetical protein
MSTIRREDLLDVLRKLEHERQESRAQGMKDVPGSLVARGYLGMRTASISASAKSRHGLESSWRRLKRIPYRHLGKLLKPSGEEDGTQHGRGEPRPEEEKFLTDLETPHDSATPLRVYSRFQKPHEASKFRPYTIVLFAAYLPPSTTHETGPLQLCMVDLETGKPEQTIATYSQGFEITWAP